MLSIKLGIFLYGNCQNYAEPVKVIVVTKVFEPYSSKNKSTFHKLFMKYFLKLLSLLNYI